MTLKDEIRNQIIENERSELKGLKDMHQTYASAADLDEESSLSMEDFAQQDQSRESAKQLEGRIERAKNALNQFINLDSGKKSDVEPGALILTDSLNFFVGISATKFTHDGKDFIGLDLDAPIYSALQNSKVGDKVTFNEKTYTIKEIL